MDERSVLGNNDIDDVRWLCSLSESELDLLIGLKSMVMMRAKRIGHEALANKFDLRMLRDLSFNFMEDLQKRVKDVSTVSGPNSKLLNKNVCGNFASMTIEELYPYIRSDQRKRVADMFFEDMAPSQKRKNGS